MVKVWSYTKIQLDVDVSPPANVMSLKALINPCDLWPGPMWPLTSTHMIFDLEQYLQDMNFFLVNFFLVDFYSSDFFSSQTDGQTDRQTDRRKATHKSPPCMSKGGLNEPGCIKRAVWPMILSVEWYSQKWKVKTHVRFWKEEAHNIAYYYYRTCTLGGTKKYCCFL